MFAKNTRSFMEGSGDMFNKKKELTLQEKVVAELNRRYVEYFEEDKRLIQKLKDELNTMSEKQFVYLCDEIQLNRAKLNEIKSLMNVR